MAMTSPFPAETFSESEDKRSERENSQRTVILESWFKTKVKKPKQRKSSKFTFIFRALDYRSRSSTDTTRDL